MIDLARMNVPPFRWDGRGNWRDAEDRHNVQHLRLQLRREPSDVVIRMECFSRPEADRYRAMLTEEELGRVLFSWVVP